MKKRIIVSVLFIAICVGLFRVGMIAGAASGTPGSVGDPLITLSYLEERLSGNSGGGQEKGYKKVSVVKGKSFFGNEGTEFIIYSGSGIVIGSQGIVNLTSGELFRKDITAVIYSIYLVPASNCGVKASSDLILYVKGQYSVK